MRERENFGQARSGTFGGEFNLANDTANPNNTGFAFANAFLGQVTSYTESMGRPGDHRRQTTFAWYGQDTWKPHPAVTVDMGLRMYKSDRPRHVLGESSVFSFERVRCQLGRHVRRCCSARSRRRSGVAPSTRSPARLCR